MKKETKEFIKAMIGFRDENISEEFYCIVVEKHEDGDVYINIKDPRNGSFYFEIWINEIDDDIDSIDSFLKEIEKSIEECLVHYRKDYIMLEKDFKEYLRETKLSYILD